MTKRSLLCVFALIVALALSLRLCGLGEKSYWIDEILTLINSTKPWSQMLVSLQQTDNNKPPLYYLFMHEWLKAGDSEAWTRLPSAIFGALTCGFLFLTGYRLIGAWVGGLAAAFLILTPYHLYYSQESRMYAMFGCEAGAALLCLILFFQEKKIAWLICFGVLSTLINYTFSYGFFFLGLGGLLLLVEWKKLGRGRALGLLFTLIISFVLFIPWLMRMVHTSNSTEGQFYKGPPWAAILYTFYSLGYGFDLGPSTNDLQTMEWRYFPAYPFETALTVLGFGVLTAIIVRGLIALRNDRFLFALTLGGMAIFLVGPAVISLLKPIVTDNPRYAFLAVLPFGLTLAVGLLALWKDGRFPRLIVVAYGILLGLSLGNFYFNPWYQREDMRAASQVVAQLDPQPAIVIVCAGYLTTVVSYYYHGPATPVGFSSYNQASFDARSLQLSDLLLGINKFAVIYARADHGDAAHQLIPWLKARYHLSEQHEWPGSGVYVFDSAAP